MTMKMSLLKLREEEQHLHQAYTARFWQQLGRKGGFCEKTPGAVPMSDGTSFRQLQNKPMAAQSWAHQWLQWCLCDNFIKKG